MIIFRPTLKLANKMGVKLKAFDTVSSSILGDWICNDLTIYGKRYVLSVSSATRIHVITEAAPYKNWIERFPKDLAQVLNKLEIPDSLIEKEMTKFDITSTYKSNNRSVMGTLNDGIKCLKHYSNYRNIRKEDISALNDRLNNTPISALEETWPEDQLRKAFNLPKKADI